MKYIRKALVLLTVLTLVFALAACSSSDNESDAEPAEDTIYRSLSDIQESGTVRIGVFSDKNPFGYVDENGEYQGYDVYFAERIGKDLGVKINYVSTEAANRVE